LKENRKSTEQLLSELSMIEMESQHILDDGSCELVAEAYRSGILTDEEWTRTKEMLREALAFLTSPQSSSWVEEGGKKFFDIDADPRNADWLRIDAAHRLSGHYLPMWSALWLWRLRMDGSPPFWRRIGNLAKKLGYPLKPP
jgi:hypothetical protein